MSVGRVVRKGRIRVDARKAMAKLREHLLVDLHLYAIEVVRAAVLAGASRIDVVFDADDVEITFDGAPLEAAGLPHLFEHLTGEAGDAPGRHLRLLALAVNAALGLSPAWVALTTSDGTSAARVAWTPALVKAIEREEAALPAAEAMAIPAGMPARGTRFHLRRKVGWDVVRRAAGKSAPREIALLTEAARCLRVPLFVNGAALGPSSRPAVLARASFALHGVRAAHVEITRGTLTAPHVDLCELGVLLATTGLGFGRHFPMAEYLRVSPPVRVVIDSDALPTNASRSAVREDAPFFGALANAAAPALADAIAGIAATVFGRGVVADGVTVDAGDPEALRDALGAFLCAAEASLLARVELPEALRAMLELPLFRDGLGRPLTHFDIPRADPLLVWNGAGPVPAAMAPWAHQMVWPAGRIAERIFAARVAMDPEELARLVRRGAARHEKMLATPAGAVALPEGEYLAREAFAISEGPFAGLVGEVAIAVDPATYVRNLGLRVFVENRCFEAFPVPEAAIPLPCLMALQWPGHITPKLGHEGVEPTAGFRAALATATQRAVLLCEGFAAARPRSGEPFDQARAAVLRAALATAVIAPTRMHSAAGVEMPALAALPALLRAPVWPTTAGGFVSLQTICEHAARTGAVCVAPPGTVGRAVDDRPVVSLRSDELGWLAKCLLPAVVMVPYAAALAASSAAARQSARAALITFIDSVAFESGAPVLHADGPARAFAVTVGASQARAWHSGVEMLNASLAPHLGGVTVAFDDDSIVPNAAWNGVLYADDQTLVARAERLYAERVVAALHGDEGGRKELFHALSGRLAVRYAWPERLTDLAPAVVRYLVDRAARGLAVDATADERELAARIARLPFLTMIGASREPEPVSLGDVARTYTAPEKISYLRERPRFRPVGWWPLVVRDERVIDALARWSGGRLVDAGGELAEQERAAERDGDHARFRGQPRVDPAAVGEHGDPASPTVHLPPEPTRGLAGVAAALSRADAELDSALVEVLFEDRVVLEQRFVDVAVPVVARVALLARASLEGFAALSVVGRGEVHARVWHAAIDLGLALLARASEAGAAHTFFGDVRALHLVLGVLSRPQPDPRLERALRGGALLWPTVQGGERPYQQLHAADGTLWAGTLTFASWVAAPGAPSELDRPILHVPPTPQGAALVGILERLGVKLRPVSDAIVKLQSTRARGVTDRPRLAARPAHPLLARELAALDVTGMDGEVGLFESGESVAELTSLDGETRRVLLDVSFPVRAVARVEVLTTSAVPIAAEKLARAAVRLLVGVVRHLDELPLFVRAHVRSLVCRAVSKGREVPPAARAAAVFPDVDGAWCALADLQADGHPEWSCTTDPPPYPRSRQEGRTLVLSSTEHLQLHAKIGILNVTAWMQRDLVAERRREAPPRPDLALDAATRAEVITSFVVDEGSLQGEIGLLQPAASARRGLHIHATRRLVVSLDDGPGWPLVAVLNDDTLHPSRWFDQVLPNEEAALRAIASKLAGNHLRSALGAVLPPAPERLAAAFLDEDVPPVAAYGSTDPMHVTGHVFLSATWPVAPTVRLYVQGLATAPQEHAVALASAVIEPSLPIGGVLFVSHAAAFTPGAASRLALALRGFLERTLSALLAASPDDPVLHTYLWNLRLLGCTALGDPTVTAADGRTVTVDEVIAALHDRRDLWLTDRRGSIDGAFPTAAPPFVLLDDGSALVRVLRARVPRARLRLLGATAAPPPAAALAPPSLPRPTPFEAPPTPPPTSTPTATSSWFTAVVARVTVLLGGIPPRAEQPSGLGEAVSRALAAMRLNGDPVVDVREVTQGKLVRYHPRSGELSINIAHPALARHVVAPSPATTRRVCLALVAAALSEVNIALEKVTDHDEAQALLELLRQEAVAGTAPRADA